MLRKLAGQTAIYGISTILMRFLNYLLSPYLTRILSTGEYGVYTYMYALIPFALVVLTFGMETGYFRFAGKAADEASKRRIFSTAWGAVSAAAALFLGLVLLFNDSIASAIGYADQPSYVWTIGTLIALDTFMAIPFARLREQNRAATYVALRSLSVVVNVAACVFLYSALPALASGGGFWASLYDPHYGAGYAFVANLIASMVTLAALIPTCRGTWLSIDGKLLRQMALFSLPLLLSGIAGTANEFIDRQMIAWLMPADMALSALGIYGAILKIGMVLTLFTQMYRQAAEPFFLSGFAREDFVKANASALKYYIIFSLVISLGIALFADLFAYIVGPDFRGGMYILPVVLLGNILSGVVFNLSFWYKKSGATHFALVVTCTGLVFTIVFNILLVPRLGYFGAAIARTLCEMAMVAVSYYLNRRHYPIPYDIRAIGTYTVLCIVIYCCGFLTSMLTDIPKYVLNLSLVAFFALYIVRREKIDAGAIVMSIFKKR